MLGTKFKTCMWEQWCNSFGHGLGKVKEKKYFHLFSDPKNKQIKKRSRKLERKRICEEKQKKFSIFF